ncbi:MAG TPA: serine hydrolase, partial [Nitrolancea sp.]|nr:serine hydrolase [Nitrolancea sp.]
MDELVRTLNELCDAQPFHTGWYLKDVKTGEEANRDGDLIGPSASTRKVAVLMTALKEIHEERLSFDQPLTPDPKYQINNSGCFKYFQPGFTLPLIDHLIMMIIVSDNVSTGMLVDMIGLDKINDYSHAIGMKNTTHRDNIPLATLPWDHPADATNATTPNDVGLILDLILAGSRDETAARKLGVTPALCQRAIEIMSWQQLTNRLPYLMPPAAKIAHKTGRGVRNYSDVGIIHHVDDPRYILT